MSAQNYPPNNSSFSIYAKISEDDQRRTNIIESNCKFSTENALAAGFISDMASLSAFSDFEVSAATQFPISAPIPDSQTFQKGSLPIEKNNKEQPDNHYQNTTSSSSKTHKNTFLVNQNENFFLKTEPSKYDDAKDTKQNFNVKHAQSFDFQNDVHNHVGSGIDAYENDEFGEEEEDLEGGHIDQLEDSEFNEEANKPIKFWTPFSTPSSFAVTSTASSSVSSSHSSSTSSSLYCSNTMNAVADVKTNSTSLNVPSVQRQSSLSNYYNHQRPIGAPSNVGNDEQKRKREIRLQKNREAARDCRNKKKQYVKRLEERVRELELQKNQLIEQLEKMRHFIISKGMDFNCVVNQQTPSTNQKFVKEERDEFPASSTCSSAISSSFAFSMSSPACTFASSSCFATISSVMSPAAIAASATSLSSSSIESFRATHHLHAEHPSSCGAKRAKKTHTHPPLNTNYAAITSITPITPIPPNPDSCSSSETPESAHNNLSSSLSSSSSLPITTAHLSDLSSLPSLGVAFPAHQQQQQQQHQMAPPPPINLHRFVTKATHNSHSSNASVVASSLKMQTTLKHEESMVTETAATGTSHAHTTTTTSSNSNNIEQQDVASPHSLLSPAAASNCFLMEPCQSAIMFSSSLSNTNSNSTPMFASVINHSHQHSHNHHQHHHRDSSEQHLLSEELTNGGGEGEVDGGGSNFLATVSSPPRNPYSIVSTTASSISTTVIKSPPSTHAKMIS